MNTGAFYPNGNSYLVAASSSTSSQTATLVSTVGHTAAHLANASTAALYIAISSVASVQAAAPTTAVPFPCLMLPAGQTRVVGIGPVTYVTASTSAGSAAPGLIVTPGRMGL